MTCDRKHTYFFFFGQTRVPEGNHLHVASYWQTLSFNVISSTLRHRIFCASVICEKQKIKKWKFNVLMHSDPWENIVVYDYVINHTFMIRVNLRTINIFHTLSHWYMLPALAFRLDSVVFVQCGLVWFGLWCLTPRHLQLYFRYIMEVSFIRGGNRRKPPICHWQTLSHIIIHFLYLMNINKDILAFYWLCFVMWFYFIFHGMTTKSSKEVIIYYLTLHWPVDIDRLPYPVYFGIIKQLITT